MTRRAGVDVAHHALAGRDRRVEDVCSIGWPGSSFGIVGSRRWLSPRLPNCATAGVDGLSVVGVDRRGTRCSRSSGSRRGGRWCRGSSGSGRAAASCAADEDGVGAVRVPSPRTGEPFVRPAALGKRIRKADLRRRCVGRRPAGHGELRAAFEQRRTFPGCVIFHGCIGSTSGSTPCRFISSSVGQWSGVSRRRDFAVPLRVLHVGHAFEALGQPEGRVALTVARHFVGDRPVVVEGGPQSMAPCDIMPACPDCGRWSRPRLGAR